jgi:hypothetical protein
MGRCINCVDGGNGIEARIVTRSSVKKKTNNVTEFRNGHRLPRRFRKSTGLPLPGS